MRKLCFLTALLLLAPGVTLAASLEELLVNKGVITNEEARATMHEGESGSAKVYWNKGTRIEFPDKGFTTSIATLIRSSYRFTDRDSDAANNVNTSSFQVDNARLNISGSALHNEFKYKLQTDFVRSPSLLDAYLEWHPCDYGWVRFGQFKTLVSRQYNTSAGSLQFADRSQATNYFNRGRQPGMLGSVSGDDGMYHLYAGIFNGASDGEGINSRGVDTNHAGTIGVRFNPMGEMNAMSEGDVEYTEDTAVSLGATYHYSEDTVSGADFEEHLVSVDANVKSEGLSVHGEFYYESQKAVGANTPDFEPLGFYLQAGYFINPKELEIAARYGMVDCDNSACSAYNSGVIDQQQQAGASLNYYWWKHNLKAQLGYDFINDDTVAGNDLNTSRWTLQLTSWF